VGRVAHATGKATRRNVPNGSEHAVLAVQWCRRRVIVIILSPLGSLASLLSAEPKRTKLGRTQSNALY